MIKSNKRTLATIVFLFIANWAFAQVAPTETSGCVSGNCSNGFGKYKIGEIAVYEGNWVKDRMEGEGTYTFTSGNVYVGHFKNDEFDGKGVMTYASGDVYEGDYVKGNAEGVGIYTFKDGSSYTGGYKNNERHGHGKEYNANKELIKEGKWKKGVFINK